MIKKGTQVQEYRSYTVSLDTIFRLHFRDTKPRKTAVAQSEIQGMAIRKCYDWSVLNLSHTRATLLPGSVQDRVCRRA